MDTLMTKESTFELTEEQMTALKAQAKALLESYNYETGSYGLEAVFKEWARQKGWLVDLFRKSEFYNGRGQIIIPTNLERPIDKDKIREFFDWAVDNYVKEIQKKEIMIGLHTMYDYDKAIDNIYTITRNLCYDHSIYNGLTREEWYREAKRMKSRMEEVGYNYEALSYGGKTVYVTSEDYRKYRNFKYVLNDVCGYNTSYDDIKILDGERLENINRHLERGGFKVRALKGQKVTKFVGKLLKETNLNHIVDVQEKVWYDDNGVEHTRKQDMGYNYHFPLLGDAINPYTYEREVVISVNPIDYWTMSFGYKWASCHTIDKENERGSLCSYEGQYSGGTEAYMLDPSSIIVYVRPSAEQLAQRRQTEMPMEEQDKFKRCVFMLGEDKLVQSRVYPDGRDGGDNGLATQLRSILQKTIADLYETSNMWTIKRGTSACCEVVTSQGILYPDYRHYDDCNVSYLRRVNGDLNTKPIVIGASRIICPCCGDKHYSEEHITCDECYEDESYIATCERCNEGIRENDDNYICANDGSYFCCSECAWDAGYVYCDDINEWTDEWREDNYNGCYYGCTDDGVEIGDYWYSCPEHAYDDGWEWCDYDDDWARREDTREIGNTGEYFDINQNDDYIQTEDGLYYPDSSYAEDDGYEEDEAGNWVLAA